jgi:hypothetical protein
LRLKLLLKRGGLLAAANWPVVAIQFIAQTTFQMLLAVPVVGAAILVALLLGADLGNLLSGGTREIFTTVTNALMAEPVALGAFIVAFGIVVVGGSILMFLVKGGTVAVMLDAERRARPIESEPITAAAMHNVAAFSVTAFVDGCQRLFRPYIVIGLALMAAYALSGAAYLAFLMVGYQSATEGALLGWTMIAALSAVALVIWITAINLIYLLLQIVTAADPVRLSEAVKRVGRFVRAEFVEIGGVFLVVLGMVLAATTASALAWSGVALIAFVPLVGLAVVPLQIIALVVRGLVFEYIGLTAMIAYMALYRRHGSGAGDLPTASLARETPAAAHRNPAPFGRPPGAARVVQLLLEAGRSRVLLARSRD